MGDQPTQPDNYPMLAYRVSALEREFKELREGYMPRREIDLQLRAINESMGRIEQGQNDIKKTIMDPDAGLQKQIQDQKSSVDTLQIRVLLWAIGIFVALGLAVASNYLIHLP